MQYEDEELRSKYVSLAMTDIMPNIRGIAFSCHPRAPTIAANPERIDPVLTNSECIGAISMRVKAEAPCLHTLLRISVV